MYNDRIFLTPQEILEKEFKTDARGYRPQEVDKFLDMVIRDYTEYMNIIKRYDHELKEMKSDNDKLKLELRRLRDEMATMPDGDSKSVNNVDLLRRISQLEKTVYGNDE